jgi:hypothetical protein
VPVTAPLLAVAQVVVDIDPTQALTQSMLGTSVSLTDTLKDPAGVLVTEGPL